MQRLFLKALSCNKVNALERIACHFQVLLFLRERTSVSNPLRHTTNTNIAALASYEKELRSQGDVEDAREKNQNVVGGLKQTGKNGETAIYTLDPPL